MLALPKMVAIKIRFVSLLVLEKIFLTKGLCFCETIFCGKVRSVLEDILRFLKVDSSVRSITISKRVLATAERSNLGAISERY